MACGIKVLSTISKSLQEKTKITFFNAIVIIYVYYWALILVGLPKTLIGTLEKQLN